MTTLKDLSRHLGLSVTQVSRAINDHSDVSEETRKRVHEAAKALNYNPNISARRLVTGRSGIVGLVLPPMPRNAAMAVYQSYQMLLAGGMSTHFARYGMHFMLHVSDEADNLADVHRRLISSGAIDGFVMVDPVINDPRIAFLMRQKVPFVLHGRTQPEPNYPFYDIDNDLVGYQLTRLLIEHGHRHIAFLNGVSGMYYTRARHRGYLRALSEAGIRPDPGFHRTGYMNEGFGLRETIRLLERKTRRPSAIIAGNSLIAKGVYSAIRAFQMEVPDDISVVAHDDEIPDVNLATFDPAVTSTRVSLERSSEPLAKFLVGKLQNLPIAELQLVETPELVLRESVAPPRFQPDQGFR